MLGSLSLHRTLHPISIMHSAIIRDFNFLTESCAELVLADMPTCFTLSARPCSPNDENII